MDRSKNPFEVTTFQQGITDDIFNQVYDAAAEIDNFIITSDGQIKSRAGSQIDETADDQIPAGVSRVGTLINYSNNEKLFAQSGQQIYYRDPINWSILTGPTGNDSFSAGDTTNEVSHTQWNRHIFLTSDAFAFPIKIYRDDVNAYQVRNNGFNFLASDPTVTVGAAGTDRYIYAFHWEYTYTAVNQIFQDVGPVTLVEVPGSSDPSVSSNTINGIPVLDNSNGENYDLANIKCFIYRTIDSGETFYKIGEVTNGTTSFVDNQSDTVIQDFDILYTDDGTVDFEAPPLSKYCHVVNETGYYANVKIGTQEFNYRVYQSVPSTPGAVPGDFFVDLEDEIIGLSSTKSIPIVFCNRIIYRLEQSFDRFGRGQINPVRLSDTAGCVSHNSIVQAENYCLWAGQDGFYATDGYTVFKISDSNNDRYRSILDAQSQRNRIVGTFNERDRRVYWCVQRDQSEPDNDSFAVLDLRWGIKPRSTFTTWSGNSFRPSTVTFFNDRLYRGDSRGYVFFHDDTIKTDPLVDVTKDAAEWSKETIIWSYKSVHINFGNTQERKAPTKILLQAENAGDTTIQITANNNSGQRIRKLTPIRWRRNFFWGDTEFVWGNPDCQWGGVGLLEQWRRFPAKSLRLSYVQLEITNGYAIITNSDTDGTATFDGTAKTIVLDDTVNNAWPVDVVGYNIRTEVDGYVREYQVIERISDTEIEVIDSEGDLPTGSYQWEIYGYKKGEELNLIGYNIYWINVSASQNTFESGQAGTNA